EAGGAFEPKGAPRPSEAAPGRAEGLGEGKSAAAGGDFADLDFLADTSAVIVNLAPDKDGVVKVSRKTIGAHALIHVVAVDPVNTTYRSTALPEQPTRFLDLR